MLSWIQKKFGAIILWSFVAVISGSFIFTGVVPGGSQTGGCSSSSGAGSVNGEVISLTDFNRAYQNRLARYRQLGDGKMTDEQLKMFRIKEGVFSELVDRKIMTQQAIRTGRIASEAELKETIQKIPAFQKDEKFDTLTYKQVLSANSLNPGSFEKKLMEDLNADSWRRYFRSRALVSQEELKQEYVSSNEKRDIRFILITSDAVKKTIEISKEEIEKFLSDTTRVNLIKSQFEGKKDTAYKGKTFDDVKNDLARTVLASEKAAEVEKKAETLATELEKSLGSSDTPALKAQLKPYGLETKTSGLNTRNALQLPGVGDAKAVLTDAFAKTSPIESGKAKKYSLPAGWVVATVIKKESADLSKFTPEERDRLLLQAQYKKERDLFESWLEETKKAARIQANDRVVKETDSL